MFRVRRCQLLSKFIKKYSILYIVYTGTRWTESAESSYSMGPSEQEANHAMLHKGTQGISEGLGLTTPSLFARKKKNLYSFDTLVPAWVKVQNQCSLCPFIKASEKVLG